MRQTGIPASMSEGCEPEEIEIEAAARAYLEWQFKGRRWDSASSSMKEKFREGARVALRAAAVAVKQKHAVA